MLYHIYEAQRALIEPFAEIADAWPDDADRWATAHLERQKLRTARKAVTQ